MAAAQADTGLIPADLHLFALVHRTAIGATADHHGGLLAALANGAHFPHLVRPGQQSGRAGEKIALKINAQPVAHYRYVYIIDGAGELPDLILGQELRLVDEDTGDFSLRKPGLELGKHIFARGKGIGRLANADAAGDAPLTSAAVELGGDQTALHPTFVVVVCGLQQKRRLARIHRGVMVIKLGHGLI